MQYLNQHSTKAEYDNHFWSRVNKTPSCWLWAGRISPKGYGLYGRAGKTRQAHRISYEKTTGEVPVGKFVLHKCGYPNCVNPAHLYIGTLKDNNRDRFLAGHYPKGEGVPNHKLTEKKVKEAKFLWKPREISIVSLAKRYRVSGSTLHAAIVGKTWSYLKDCPNQDSH